MIIVLFIAAFIAMIWTYLFRSRFKAPRLRYPPGPVGVSMPTHNPWIQYKAWGKEYGELIYIRDRNSLIVNDLQVATDLLEKRARIYSDREPSVMVALSGLGEYNFAFMRYSDTWRIFRKTFLQSFRQAKASQFHFAERKQVQKFLQRLILEPSDNMRHIMALSQNLIYDALYGLDLEPDDDMAQSVAHIVEENLDYIFSPEISSRLNRYPWLEYLPSWFPGCGFKKIADECRKELERSSKIPLDLAVNNLKAGLKTSLIAELVIQKEGDLGAINGMGVASALAGADTTGSSISSFLLAMIKYPEVQAKAQAEIDHVVGQDRLPIFEDRESLPYVESVYREVMRLYPPVPLGVSHVSIEDDFYRDYYIPKGCAVFANIWAINRDPSLYSDPDTFRPERFLDSPKGPFRSINDITAFGFGRRVCPGRYMAEDSVWLAIASVLATLNVGKAKDEEGNEIEPSGEYTPGPFFSHPKPYRFATVPRSPRARAFVLAAEQE
ncbi:hypothetical protein D9757_012449 [Collybiopsis confluens]|uniref:Cytochrome P450 n=1 Tax=Collybiopsis confluens TaxID=2823264 RepID=A0A8H5FYP6_9AGAR|nr:hypothetical protein D9757_012449 [Collybiopsis confluens]